MKIIAFNFFILLKRSFYRVNFMFAKNLIISRILYICTPFYDNGLEKGFLRT